MRINFFFLFFFIFYFFIFYFLFFIFYFLLYFIFLYLFLIIFFFNRKIARAEWGLFNETDEQFYESFFQRVQRGVCVAPNSTVIDYLSESECLQSGCSFFKIFCKFLFLQIFKKKKKDIARTREITLTIKSPTKALV